MNSNLLKTVGGVALAFATAIGVAGLVKHNKGAMEVGGGIAVAGLAAGATGVVQGRKEGDAPAQNGLSLNR